MLKISKDIKLTNINIFMQNKNRDIDLLNMLSQRTKGSNVYMKRRPSESFINIHLIHA